MIHFGISWSTKEHRMQANPSDPEAKLGRSSDHLPVAALLAFAMAGFIAILTETLPAGLLALIGRGLHVSPAAAGQLVTTYAAGSLLAAIPLTAATQGWRRRPVLLLSVAGLLVFNTVTAASNSYALTLAARFFAGTAAGLAWGMIAGYARGLVPPALQGRGLALAMVGVPVALSLGTPAGALLGALAGWRVAFLVISALALLLSGWILWAVPDRPGREGPRRLQVTTVLRAPGIRPVLLVIFAWMLAHNVLYTFIVPFVSRAGLGGRVDLVLLGFGVAALASIWIVGVVADRWLRRSVLASLAGFALVCLVLIAFDRMPAVVLAAAALWGLSFGGAATLLGTASADAAGDGVDVAQAMVTTAWNMAIAGGGLVGGVLLDHLGPVAFPYAMLIAVLIAAAIVWRSAAYGFPPGARVIRATQHQPEKEIA